MNDDARHVIFAIICLWGTYEAIWGLSQVFQFNQSSNAAFVLTGHFGNPGPYGGFMAITMSVAGNYLIHYRNNHDGLFTILYVLAACCVIFGILVLPASMSRAAWISFAAAIIYSVFSDKDIRTWFLSKKVLLGTIFIVFIALCVGMFALKQDSALGRLHMWRIEALAIAEHPFGTGFGTALGTYAVTQEGFFREHLEDTPASIIRVAGCPEYPFNEYLGIGMEFGVLGMLLFCGIIIGAIYILNQRNSVFASGMIAWAVFAAASYPLSLPQTSVLFLTFLALAVPSSKPLSHKKVYACSLIILIVIIISLAHLDSRTGIIDRSSYRELYQSGYILSRSGEYESSNEVLSQGKKVSSDPVFHIIMGHNYRSLSDYEQAEEEYWRAYYTVPSRIYPLVCLMRLKLSLGENSEAERLGRQIVSMPVTKGHLSMLRLRKEAEQALDSLKRIL